MPVSWGRGLTSLNQTASPLMKKLDAEDPGSTEFAGHPFGDALTLAKGRVGHRLGLPGLLVVTAFLAVADRLAERHATAMTNRQQGDLVVEIDESLDDHLVRTAPGTLPGFVPGHHGGIRCADGGLSLAR